MFQTALILESHVQEHVLAILNVLKVFARVPKIKWNMSVTAVSVECCLCACLMTHTCYVVSSPVTCQLYISFCLKYATYLPVDIKIVSQKRVIRN